MFVSRDVCNGPTSYFGPAAFNASTRFSFRVLLEDHATLLLELFTTHVQASVSTNGTWTVGNHSGHNANFLPHTWHKIDFETTPSSTRLVLDGTMLGNVDTPLSNGFALLLKLDRYIFANIDDFMVKV